MPSALDVVGIADDGRLGHRFVGHQRALNLGGPNPVARHVQDVVDPPR